VSGAGRRRPVGPIVFRLAPCGANEGPTGCQAGGTTSAQIRSAPSSVSPWDHVLDRLLHVLESAWDCPPCLEEVLESLPLLIPQLHDARAAFEDFSRSVHPRTADGRLCTLMPFCCLMTPEEIQGHLVLEEPSAAIGRLQRLGLGFGHSVALWERSLRNAVLALEGTPTEVCIASDTGTTAPARAQPSGSVELWRVAAGLAGSHASLPPVEVPDETPTTTRELERLRRYWAIGPR
jgi:hypothetical protein